MSVRNEDTVLLRRMVSNAIDIFISNGKRNITTSLSRLQELTAQQTPNFTLSVTAKLRTLLSQHYIKTMSHSKPLRLSTTALCPHLSRRKIITHKTLSCGGQTIFNNACSLLLLVPISNSYELKHSWSLFLHSTV